MTVGIQNQNLIQTANVYKLFSLLYAYPCDENLDEVLDYLEQSIAKIRPELSGYVVEMKKVCESESDIEELKVDYAKLFLGPFDLLAPPYGSVYLDGQRRIMGDSTMKVLEFYRKAGLNIAEDMKQPPDFIVTELEFMYYLLAKYIETDDKQWIVQYEEFMNKFFKRWIGDFTERVREQAKTMFYRNLAFLTLAISSPKI